MKFRKKPVVVEAMQFFDETDVILQIKEFTGLNPMRVSYKIKGKPQLIIPTLEGDHAADVGDWIIKGVNGEFYPCKPDIFDKTYELAED